MSVVLWRVNRPTSGRPVEDIERPSERWRPAGAVVRGASIAVLLLAFALTWRQIGARDFFRDRTNDPFSQGWRPTGAA